MIPSKDIITTKQDIMDALIRLGICKGDIVLVHSSLKSMGYVEGGAEAVINAFLEVLSPDGTLVMPTLIQKDFVNAYQTWYMDKPSDTGYITEVFRKFPGAVRSNQATHSVAALGKIAVELTKEHTAYGHRFGAFGDTPFSKSSLWQKLFDLNAKVVMAGVGLEYNTCKHLIEYILVEERLQFIQDPKKVEEEKAKLVNYFNGLNGKVWPSFGADKMQEAFRESGLLHETTCQNAVFYTFRAGDTGKLLYRAGKEHSRQWFTQDAVKWLEGE